MFLTQNVDAFHVRAENFSGRFNYIVSRAVCSFTRLVELSEGKLSGDNSKKGFFGIYSLKGGDLSDELAQWENMVKVHHIRNFFSEDYFLTKCIVYLPSEHAAKAAGVR
jgi:16S rRNA (guanine527-N7)-methyltransferase